MDSASFNRKIISTGTYATIYKIENDEEEYVIKSQSIKEKNKVMMDEAIDDIIREYIFYKIASILEVGPALRAVFGYDILCFDDRIEFAIEYCPRNFIREEDCSRNLKEEEFSLELELNEK